MPHSNRKLRNSLCTQTFSPYTQIHADYAAQTHPNFLLLSGTHVYFPDTFLYTFYSWFKFIEPGQHCINGTPFFKIIIVFMRVLSKNHCFNALAPSIVSIHCVSWGHCIIGHNRFSAYATLAAGWISYGNFLWACRMGVSYGNVLGWVFFPQKWTGFFCVFLHLKINDSH